MLRQRMTELGDGVPIDPTDKTQLMWTMINDFCELFCNTIRGKYDKRLSIYQDAVRPHKPWPQIAPLCKHTYTAQTLT